jgi:hypothetical protein
VSRPRVLLVDAATPSTMYGWRHFLDKGGMMSHGPDIPATTLAKRPFASIAS